ncbi:MAG TPA: type II toxin-antitoxin system HicA family toxin [Kribbellaceae bacterium]|nr:type II toxin-antitoxin system HicA family toxin [Kribbellaceae bacterium]
MAQVPSIRGDRVVAQLKKRGYRVDRVNGSHHIMKRDADGRGTTVPVHGGRDVAKGTLRSILSDVGLTPQQLMDEKIPEQTQDEQAQTMRDPRDGVADPNRAATPPSSTPEAGNGADQRRHDRSRGRSR